MDESNEIIAGHGGGVEGQKVAISTSKTSGDCGVRQIPRIQAPTPEREGVVDTCRSCSNSLYLSLSSSYHFLSHSFGCAVDLDRPVQEILEPK